MVAGLQRIVDLLRAASGASSVTGQPSTVHVCHCMHVLGAEAAEDSKWGPLLPEEINGHANPNPNPNPYPNPNPNPNPDPNQETAMKFCASILQKSFFARRAKADLQERIARP